MTFHTSSHNFSVKLLFDYEIDVEDIHRLLVDRISDFTEDPAGSYEVFNLLISQWEHTYRKLVFIAYPNNQYEIIHNHTIHLRA